jgi:hypothetical protein
MADAEPMPTLIRPMLATAGKLPDRDAAFGYETKWDGVWAIAYLDDGARDRSIATTPMSPPPTLNSLARAPRSARCRPCWTARSRVDDLAGRRSRRSSRGCICATAGHRPVGRSGTRHVLRFRSALPGRTSTVDLPWTGRRNCSRRWVWTGRPDAAAHGRRRRAALARPCASGRGISQTLEIHRGRSPASIKIKNSGPRRSWSGVDAGPGRLRGHHRVPAARPARTRRLHYIGQVGTGFTRC